jgi:spermidine synthase
LRTIVRTFTQVFPEAEAYLAHFCVAQPLIALVGHLEPTRYSPGWMASRVNERGLAEDLIRLRLDSDFALFGGFLASGPGLEQLAGEGPMNTDDHPIVTFQAPDFVYAGPKPAWKLLLTLVDARDPAPGDLLEEPGDTDSQEFGDRLRAYWKASDAYLKAGVDIQPSNDARLMLAQVGRPLLPIVRMSGDFAPAYRPLLVMAYELYETDPGAARTLLEELDAANPKRPEARRLQQCLFGG